MRKSWFSFILILGLKASEISCITGGFTNRDFDLWSSQYSSEDRI